MLYAVFQLLVGLQFALAAPMIPKVSLEYSYALDMYCPQQVGPKDPLTAWQQALIPKIPYYRDQELLGKLSWFQSEWNKQGNPLLTAAAVEVGKPFPMRDLSAALYLCPRWPFMGTPLGFNVISYLHLAAQDMPTLAGKPMPIFFFVSTAFHEILHKYISSILQGKRSAILNRLGTDLTSLYGGHLHLFALQKKVFTDLGLSHLLPAIGQLEILHGKAMMKSGDVENQYEKAWKAVHNNPAVYRSLLRELKN